MKKVEELKDLGCSVRGRFYDLAWSKPVLRAPAVHGVSSLPIVVQVYIYNVGHASDVETNLFRTDRSSPRHERL